MKHTFHPEALEEYLNAVSYYTEINPRLGEVFVDAVESIIEQILVYNESGQAVEEGVRRCLVKRFPFGIYYCVESKCIVIYAVMHMSRRPDSWKRRLRKIN